MDGLRKKLCHSADYLTCLGGGHVVKLFLISIYPVHLSLSNQSESVVIQVQYWFHLLGLNRLRSFQLAFLSTSRLCLSLRSI